MTKLAPVPLTPENRVPHKRTESNYDQSDDGEANLLVESVQPGTNLIFSETVHHELKQNDFDGGSLVGVMDSQCKSNGSRILCIEEFMVSEADSELILLNFTKKNTNIPDSIKKSESWEPTIEPEFVDDLVVSVEQNGQIRESKSTFSGSLVKDCEEKKRIEQNSRLDASPLWGLASICGRRKQMEDTVVALPGFLRIPSYMLCDIPDFSSIHQDLTAHVFGVYDGHGGCQVANFCRDHLHLVLAEEIGIAKETWHVKPVECNWEQLWLKIFLNCFHKLDDEVGGFFMIDGDVASNTYLPSFAPESVGSTAVVAVVCSTHIIVANCGDSRAVLRRGKVCMPLSVDHKPNREDECMRIEAVGGRIIDWDGYRVSGFLAVSRSIGDRYLRPYVVADPEVMFVPRTKEDECLILASDGLWDVITNEEACDLARRRILLWYKRNGSVPLTETGKDIDPAAQDAADCLLQLAFQRGSKDNISVIVIDLKAQRKFKKKT